MADITIAGLVKPKIDERSVERDQVLRMCRRRFYNISIWVASIKRLIWNGTSEIGSYRAAESADEIIWRTVRSIRIHT